MKKKGRLALAVFTALSLVISACGSNGSAPAPESSAPAGTGEQSVKLKFWGAVAEENGPKDVADAWNQANPDIQVEYVRYVNDESGNTKLDTALISQSDAPDIFISYGETYLMRRVNAGMAYALDELIAKEGFQTDEVIGLDNIITFDGKIYYLPAMKLINAILLNQSALEEAGQKLPEQWTWEEHNALAKTLTKGDRLGAFISPPTESIPRFTLLQSKPVDPYYTDAGSSNFDSAAIRKGLELQKELYDNGSMLKWSEAIANKAAPQTEFLTGKAAMVFGGTHFIRYVKDTKSYPRDFKVTFAPVPQYEEGGNVNTAGFNDFMSINKNSKNKEAAMKFVSWYLTEGNKLMIPGGRLPSSKQANIDEVADLFVGEGADLMDVDALKRVLKQEYRFPMQAKSTAFAELTKVLQEEAEKYFLNVQSLDKTMEALKTRADQAIQAAGK